MVETDLRFREWTEFRALIVHEDNLVNHRITWLLSLQGFLLAGFFVIQSAAAKSEVPKNVGICLEIILFFVMIGAIWICWICAKLISAAFANAKLAADTWGELHPDQVHPKQKAPGLLFQRAAEEFALPSPTCRFPPIQGRFQLRRGEVIEIVPLILLGINVAAALTCVYMGWQEVKRTPDPRPAITAPAKPHSSRGCGEWCHHSNPVKLP